jgi:phosphoglycolate phosphatase
MLRLLPYLESKKHIIFDYNGTILYDTQLCVEALNVLLSAHALPSVSEDHYRQHFHFPISSFYKQMGFNFELESFESLGQRYMHHYLSNLHRCSVYEGLRDLLKALRHRQQTTSILTALHQDALHHQLEMFQLKPYFDAAFGLPDHHAHSKVQRGIELMNHVNIAPEDTIIIGDTDHDLQVADALGVDIILLADGHQNEERLLKTRATVVDLQRRLEKSI